MSWGGEWERSRERQWEQKRDRRDRERMQKGNKGEQDSERQEEVSTFHTSPAIPQGNQSL